MNVLVVNAGSSSLKYQLFDTAANEVKGKGICERIGIEGSRIEHKKDGNKIVDHYDEAGNPVYRQQAILDADGKPINIDIKKTTIQKN